MKFTNSVRLFNSKNNNIENNSVSKRMVDVSTGMRRVRKKDNYNQTDIVPVKNMEIQSEDYKLFKMVHKGNKFSPDKSQEVFETSNKFATLNEEDFDGNNCDEKYYTLDQDDTLTRRALEGRPQDVKIVKERRSLNPQEYRTYELNTGENVIVPVLKKTRITRSTAKQLNLKFPLPDKPVKKYPSSSTPTKSKKQKGKGIIITFTKNSWLVYK